MDRIKSAIYSILSDQFNASLTEISDEIGPGDLEKWDSLGQLQLIMRLEQEFNVRLSVNDVMVINNVKDIIEIIKKNSSKAQATIPSIKDVAFKGTSTSSLRLPKATFWGEGSITALNKVDQSRIVMITGTSSYVTEIIQRIQELLSNKAELTFIQRPPGEPVELDVYKLGEKLKEFSPDLIIAVGGGSTIDIAKLSWALYEHPHFHLDNMLTPFSLPPLRTKSSFLAIPTTFGSGSEVSSSSAFTENGCGSKKIIISHEFLPDLVILDPNLGKTMPLNIVYASAFDALTHSVEGYASIIDNPVVDPYAIFAAENILNALVKIQKQGFTSDVRRLLCYSAYYAGIVQNHCSVGLTHSIAHQLGKYGINHGLGNAMFLTSVMEINAKRSKKYNQLGAECGFGSFNRFIDAIQDIFDNSNILPDSQILKRIIDDNPFIIESAMNDITFKANPIPLDKDDVELVFDKFQSKFLS